MLPIWLALLLALALPSAATASVVLAPASGPAGSTTTVEVDGLPPFSGLEMRVGRGEVEAFVADGDGLVSADVAISKHAGRKVRVAVQTEAGERAVLRYRVASRFSSRRSAEAGDWEGRVLRVTTNLDIGRLVARVELWGLARDSEVAVKHDGRRVARTSANGTRTKRLRVALPGDAAGRELEAEAGDARLTAPLETPPAMLAAVGDIACKPDAEPTPTTCRHADTARLAGEQRPDAVALLGDIQYERATLPAFRQSFHPTWGQLEMPLRPVPGNHEYRTEDARDYFAYFEEQASWRPPSWYAYNLGPWHIIALNSNCDRESVPCGGGEEQVNWLRAELAADDHRCTLAYWHHPRYSSGFHGSDRRVIPFWRILQRDQAEVVVAGHDHNYERFARQNATGQLDPAGMRSFVVGTGGKNTTPLRSPRAPHSEHSRDDSHGVMFLRLYEDAYSWRYVGIDGRVLDAGSGSCQ